MQNKCFFYSTYFRLLTLDPNCHFKPHSLHDDMKSSKRHVALLKLIFLHKSSCCFFFNVLLIDLIKMHIDHFMY